MPEAVKALRHEWSTINGQPAIVFHGGEPGHEVAIAVPAGIFIALSGEARIRAVAAEKAGDNVTLPPPWHHGRFLMVSQIDVGQVETTGPQRVGVIFDRDRPTEMFLSFDPSDAREFARELVAEAAIAEGAPSQKLN